MIPKNPAIAAVFFFTLIFSGWPASGQNKRPPKRDVSEGQIVLYGHSLFTQWKTAAEDLKPLPIHNLAFGGSKTNQLTQKFGQVVNGGISKTYNIEKMVMLLN